MAKMPTPPVLQLNQIRDPEALRAIEALLRYIEALKAEVERNTP